MLPSWFIGCLLFACASFCSALGIVLQKHAHNRGRAAPSQHSGHWWGGLALIVVGAGSLESAAFAFAPLSTLSPLFCLAVAFNAPIAVCYLGEKISLRCTAATAVVIVGTAGTAAFGSHAEKSHTPEEVLAYSRHWVVWAYIGFVLIVVTASVIAVCRIREAGGPGAALPPVFQKVGLAQERQSSVHWQHSGLIYANFAAVLGSLQALSLKLTVDACANVLRQGGQAAPLLGVLALPQMRAIDVAAVGISVTLLSLFGVWCLAVMNEGLRLHEAITFGAQFKALVTVYSCLTGMIVFREFYDLGVTRAALFAGSVAAVILGLFMFPAGGGDEEERQQTGAGALPENEQDDFWLNPL